MTIPQATLDNIVLEILRAENTEAEAVLLAIIRPGPSVHPVFAARPGTPYASFLKLAEVLRLTADRIEEAHKAAEGKLP